MAQSLSVMLKIEDVAANQITASGGKRQLQMLYKYIGGLIAGSKNGYIDVQSSTSAPVAAAGRIVLASFAAASTVTIGGVTFTGSSTPSGEEQFEIDGNDAADAAALVAKINAHSTLSKVVSAVVTTGSTIDLTCKLKGVIGNFIVMSQTGDQATLTQFAGGTGGAQGTAQSYSVGL